VKFLLNMNLPRQLAQNFASLGHEARHVADIGMAPATPRF
jgi:predicted nuclease of predicted toxin-antitoxin system